MEEVKIVFQKEAILFLDDLIEILFRKNYFSYKENSEAYVSDIYQFIEENISSFPNKNVPNVLKHLGSKYIFYNSNQRTTWFVFFENQNNNYLITYILNNHCIEAKYL